MRWEDERYVRMFTRDTASWVTAPWEARAVLPLVLRKLDRAGTLDLSDDGLEALAAIVMLPLVIVQAGMAWWFRKGTLELVGGWLVMPNFLDAQEARASDAARARESRARTRDLARAGGVVTKRDSQLVTNRDDTITKRDESVTRSHTASHVVTPSCAVPSRTEPTNPPTPRRGGSDFVPNPIEDGVDGMAVAAWCEGIRSVTGARAAPRPQRGALRALLDALTGQRPPDEEPVSWARRAAIAYAKANVGRTVSEYGFASWLSSGNKVPGVPAVRVVPRSAPTDEPEPAMTPAQSAAQQAQFAATRELLAKAPCFIHLPAKVAT